MQVIITIEDKADLEKLLEFVRNFQKPVIILEKEIPTEAIASQGERGITANPDIIKPIALKWLENT